MFAAVPADHGPTDAYWTPRQATAARIASVSNDSATKSAIAIGRTRRIVWASRLPRPRNVRPSFSPASASPRPGAWMSGGVCPAISPRNFPSARTNRSKSGQASASWFDQPRSPSTVLAWSLQNVTARPSSWGANKRTSGARSRKPWDRRSRSRTTDGRSRPTVCARRGTRTPPSSAVSAAPPTRSRRSRTTTRRPARARYAAVTRALCPPPMTATSYVSAIVRRLVGRGRGALPSPRSGRWRP